MPKYTDKQIGDALISAGGMVYVAAKGMGCSPDTIKARLRKSSKLRAIKDAESEIVLDNAETRLADAIKAGEPWAIQFALKTKGKARGYVERGEIKHTGEVAHTHVDERNKQYDALFSELDAYRTGFDDGHRESAEEQSLRSGSADGPATQIP